MKVQVTEKTEKYPKSVKITTNALRICFPNVFVAVPNDFNNEKNYELTILIPKKSEDAKVIKTHVDELLAELATKRKGKDKFFNPLRDGDTDDYAREEYAGCYWMKLRLGEVDKKGNKRQAPTILNTDGQPFDEFARGDFYSGCMAKAMFSMVAYEKGDGGVGAYLEAAMKVADGERIGGKRSATAADFGEDEGEL